METSRRSAELQFCPKVRYRRAELELRSPSHGLNYDREGLTVGTLGSRRLFQSPPPKLFASARGAIKLSRTGTGRLIRFTYL